MFVKKRSGCKSHPERFFYEYYLIILLQMKYGYSAIKDSIVSGITA